MPSPKRILFITPGLRRGGAETQLMRIAKYFIDNEYQVKIISLKPINDFDLDGYDVSFFGNWKKRPFSNLRNTHLEIKKFKPDVVIAFMFAAIIVARFLRSFSKFILISSFRNSEIGNKWARVFKLTKEKDDIVTYNAPHSKANFEERGMAKTGGVVIPNAVPISMLTPKNVNPVFTWLSVAHFRSSKDYPTLFKAIALLKEYPFEVNVLGHLYDNQWPFDMLKELGIADKVHIRGFSKDTQNFYRASDAFVLSSKWEGSPNAVLEAMLNQIVVVGSNIGGIREVVLESGGGFLFSQGNENELADTMLKVMQLEKTKAERIGNKGRKYIIENFSEEIIFSKWESLVLSSLAAKSSV